MSEACATPSRSRQMLSSLFSVGRKRRRDDDSDHETSESKRRRDDDGGSETASFAERKRQKLPWKPKHAQSDAMLGMSVAPQDAMQARQFAKPRGHRGVKERASCPALGVKPSEPAQTYGMPRYAGRDAMFSVSIAQRSDVTAKIPAAARGGFGGTGSSAAEYRRALDDTGLVSVAGTGQGLFSSPGGRWLAGPGGVTAANPKVAAWGRDAGHDKRVSMGVPQVMRTQSSMPLGMPAPLPRPSPARSVAGWDPSLAAALRRMEGAGFDVAPFGRPHQPLRHTVSQPTGLEAQYVAQADSQPALRSPASLQVVRPYAYRPDATVGEVSAECRRPAAAASQQRQVPPMLRQGSTSSYVDLTAQRRGAVRPPPPQTSVSFVLPLGKGKGRVVESSARSQASVPATPSVPRAAAATGKDSRQHSLEDEKDAATPRPLSPADPSTGTASRVSYRSSTSENVDAETALTTPRSELALHRCPNETEEDQSGLDADTLTKMLHALKCEAELSKE
ncbi:hypothetical protein LTR56_013346 [Elasticomyces elasticus]|nr:hypothetical protein LTR22_020173 [Elasticomyces elasticus]KAK3637946.1 hypothetical protein LTR56_013346 [Elasticomyces elasticus]KAK4910713.1 hypothetical protein LTR49_020652 [Elasticomyces elasticus]KAK5751456.1 hypothetical protein LTS12_018467 [Elasticomyces elasticus]